MEVTVRRDETGENILEMGPVTLTIKDDVVKSLRSVMTQRLSQSSGAEQVVLEKKLNAYKTLASKMRGVDGRIIQKLAVQLTPEQLVTMVRLAPGQDLYKKVLENMSKSNRMQFEDDYKALDRITVHQACIYMEQIVPKIKAAAQEQKRLQQSL